MYINNKYLLKIVVLECIIFVKLVMIVWWDCVIYNECICILGEIDFFFFGCVGMVDVLECLGFKFFWF